MVFGRAGGEYRVGTDFYHPGNHMEDQRNNEDRKTVAEAVRDIDQRTARMEILLFEPEEGFVPRTGVRLKDHGGRIKTIEERVWLWIGIASVLGPIFVVLIQKYIFSAVVK